MHKISDKFLQIFINNIEIKYGMLVETLLRPQNNKNYRLY